MKRLTLIRHAKSDWGDASLADFDRPLNKRGHRNAKFMAELLASEGFRPDWIASSSALRALTTAKVVAAAVGYPEGKIHEEPSIYEAPPSRILAVVHDTPPDVEHLCVFGHNPGMELTANRLLYQDSIDRLVTCGIVEMTLLVDEWSACDHDVAELVQYRFPKMFPDA